jgi:hypothetical protein
VTTNVSSGIQTINDTPFVKDVKGGGLLNGLVSGTERERLRSVVENLKTEHELGAGIEYLLKKYDIFSESFTRKEIVENWRNRLIHATNGKRHSEESNLFETSSNNETNQLYLYVVRHSANKYVVSTTYNLKETYTAIEIVEKIDSPHDELKKVYELMCKHGVANVRGSRYQEWKMNLNEATELIKTITYLNGEILVVDKNNIPDKTVIETFMLLCNGFTVDEISEMKLLLPSTIQCHLDKSTKCGLRLEKYIESKSYDEDNEDDEDIDNEDDEDIDNVDDEN